MYQCMCAVFFSTSRNTCLGCVVVFVRNEMTRRALAGERVVPLYRLDDHAGARGRRRHCEGGGHVSVAHFCSCVQSTPYPFDENPSHGQFDVTVRREQMWHVHYCMDVWTCMVHKVFQCAMQWKHIVCITCFMNVEWCDMIAHAQDMTKKLWI